MHRIAAGIGSPFIEIVTPLDVLEWTWQEVRASCYRALAFAMLDIDRVVLLNPTNVDEFLFHRIQFVTRGGYDEMLD